MSYYHYPQTYGTIADTGYSPAVKPVPTTPPTVAHHIVVALAGLCVAASFVAFFAADVSVVATFAAFSAAFAAATTFASSTSDSPAAFGSAGVVLLASLMIIPVWDALDLLHDTNYIFWAGRSIPIWIISLCVAVVFLYTMTIKAFFGHARPEIQKSEQTIMMIGNIFLTLLGLVLIVMSMPLLNQVNATYTNLMRNCELSFETHRIYEYSMVLHNIRRQPECVAKRSVEQCEGYQESRPYTSYLKNLENDLRCSGFCYQMGNGTSGASDIETANAMRASFISPTIQYPPTLFSDTNYQASCEGMAARDIKSHVGGISKQLFDHGLYLVAVAVGTGLLTLTSFCVSKKRDLRYEDLGSGGRP